MQHAVRERATEASIVVMAAAISDYRPATMHETKMKRSDGGLTLTLEPTPDILAELGSQKGSRIIIGFAAETNNVAENARAKLARKSADMIVANDVTQEGAGFDTDTNIVTMYLPDAPEISLPKLNKLNVANRIFDQALSIRKNSK
jgi:phosphopantothenoylcysteine decarboxylase / phosphopantothenate---cysteine ligase